MTDKQKLRRLTKALEFYADPTTYLAIGMLADPPCGDFLTDVDQTEYGRKPGKRARRALAAVSPKASDERVAKVVTESPRVEREGKGEWQMSDGGACDRCGYARLLKPGDCWRCCNCGLGVDGSQGDGEYPNKDPLCRRCSRTLAFSTGRYTGWAGWWCPTCEGPAEGGRR